ncbi:MAG: UDP-2,3-diacylglucosamine diphosphatase LpxI [Verrucomicrobia bacterium]|nr:UDP-2,3-diacylglucosamine diphosphatase LpxI [Verrucomicrobiota bacterium]
MASAFPAHERFEVKVGQIGKLLKGLRSLQVGYAVMVGQVTPGKLFRDLTPDLKALAILARLKERNADTIFSAIADEIAAIGVKLLDARAFMDSHLADEGVMTGGRCKADPQVLEFGIRMAREIARLNIGQGVVVRKGTVLAVEAFEGTDDMLARANKYKTDNLVFVKTTKVGQNPHFDWPVFGLKTLDTMAEAGITTAALEAGRTVIIDKDEVLRCARQRGIQIIGYKGMDG